MLIMGGLFNDNEPTCFEPKIGSQCGLLLGQETMEVNPKKQGAQWWWALRNDINGYRIPENIVSLVGGKYVSRVLRLSCLRLIKLQREGFCH